MAEDPLAEARARAERNLPWIVARAGGLWSSERVAAHLGTDPESVERMARDGSLLRVQDRGYEGFPACQFDEAGIIPGLPEVIRAIDSTSAWTKLNLLFSHTLWSEQPEPETVLEAVRHGRMRDALHAARTWGEHLGL